MAFDQIIQYLIKSKFSFLKKLIKIKYKKNSNKRRQNFLFYMLLTSFFFYFLKINKLLLLNIITTFV